MNRYFRIIGPYFPPWFCTRKSDKFRTEIHNPCNCLCIFSLIYELSKALRAQRCHCRNRVRYRAYVTLQAVFLLTSPALTAAPSRPTLPAAPLPCLPSPTSACAVRGAHSAMYLVQHGPRAVHVPDRRPERHVRWHDLRHVPAQAQSVVLEVRILDKHVRFQVQVNVGRVDAFEASERPLLLMRACRTRSPFPQTCTG